MSDYAAQVREKVELLAHYDDGEPLGAALLAVLDLHAPHPERPGYCRTCLHWDQSAQQYEDFPCPTYSAVGEALGIEAGA